MPKYNLEGVPEPLIAEKIVEAAVAEAMVRVKAGEAAMVHLTREEVVAIYTELHKSAQANALIPAQAKVAVKDWFRDAAMVQLGRASPEVLKRFPVSTADPESKRCAVVGKAWDISGSTTGASWCPDEYVPEVIMNAMKESPWLALVNKRNMGRRTQTRPTLTDNITVGWEAYAGAGSSNYHKSATTDPTTSSKTLTAKWVYVLMEVPNDLLSDMEPDIGAELQKLINGVISRYLETWGITGSSGTDPWNGILNTTSVGTDSVGANPAWADYIKLVHSIRPPYRAGAVLTMNDDALQRWEQATDLQQRPLFLEPSELAPQGRIGRFPVVLTENIATTNDSTYVIVGNPGNPQHGWIQGYRSQLGLLVDPYSNKGENATDFLWELRTDGLLKTGESHAIITQATA